MDGQAWELGTASQIDHFPYSNKLYTDAFWTTRWANGISPPSGASFSGPHIIVITVKNGEQRFIDNGVVWVENTLSGGFTLPPLFKLFTRYPASNTVFNAGLLSDRAFSKNEALSLSRNPWKILKERHRVTYIDLGAGGGTLNASATGGATASGAATLEAQIALAAVGIALAGGSAAASVAVPLSAAGIAVSGGSATGTATVQVSAAGLAQAAGQAGLAASVLLAAAAAAQSSGNASLAAQLAALASGAAEAGGAANLTGGAPGEISAAGGAQASGAAVLSVTVQLAATGAAQAAGSATGNASAPGQVSASGGAQSTGSATVSVTVQLTAAGFVQAMGAGQFSAVVPLAAFGHALAAGNAVMAISDGSVTLAPGPARYRVKAAPRLRRVFEQRNYMVKK